jgi:hypothetical protein
MRKSFRSLTQLTTEVKELTILLKSIYISVMNHEKVILSKCTAMFHDRQALLNY